MVTLGRAPYTIARGASGDLKVKLAQVINRLANRKGRLHVVAVASTVGATTVSRHNLTLTLRR